jgi:predicted transglutaminase-like cysteine proteinase
LSYQTKLNLFRQIILSTFLVLYLSLFSFARELNENKIRQSFKKLGGNEQVLNEWINLLNSSNDLSDNAKLKRINDYFNQRIIFTDDQENWGVSDYWATVLETLSKGKGDCEDYVIAKYFSLRNLNISDTQLRLIYVKARLGGVNSSIQQAHMVLAYYANPESEPIILDNLISDIRPSSKRPDLFPVFSFNSQGIYAGVAAKSTLAPGGTSRLSRWQDLLNRSRIEGVDQ